MKEENILKVVHAFKTIIKKSTNTHFSQLGDRPTPFEHFSYMQTKRHPFSNIGLT